MFVNRIEELNYLEKLQKEQGARFIIMYGRRRIGKTELLRQFSKDKKHPFFPSNELYDLKRKADIFLMQDKNTLLYFLNQVLVKN